MKPFNLYIAFENSDQLQFDQLRAHLTPIEQIGTVKIWDENSISLGMNREEASKNALLEADLILLLISSSFFASDHHYETVLPLALAQHKSGFAEVIPVLLRPCNYQLTPIAAFEIFPKNGNPISNWASTDHAFSKLVAQLAQFIQKQQNTALQNDHQFRDTRDGKIYPTLEFNNLLWMTKNLDFDTEDGCWFYNNDPANGTIYGRLYTHQAAQKACPEGWRLPTAIEWKTLIEYCGNHLAFKPLMKGGVTQLDFLPAGKYTEDGRFVLQESDGFYWTDNAVNFLQAKYVMFDRGMQAIRLIDVGKGVGASCRCVRV